MKLTQSMRNHAIRMLEREAAPTRRKIQNDLKEAKSHAIYNALQISPAIRRVERALNRAKRLNESYSDIFGFRPFSVYRADLNVFEIEARFKAKIEKAPKVASLLKKQKELEDTIQSAIDDIALCGAPQELKDAIATWEACLRRLK